MIKMFKKLTNPISRGERLDGIKIGCSARFLELVGAKSTRVIIEQLENFMNGVINEGNVCARYDQAYL